MKLNNINILITGGAGFFGHHVCEHFLKSTDYNIDIIDRLSYSSSGFDRLKDVNCYDDKRIRHFTHNITLPVQEGLLEELQGCDYIIHLAAETHVDRSIENPEPFVMSNVVGTMRMLDFARQCTNLKKFFYMSTDEVFGPAHIETHPNGFTEWERYNSTNPYSAAKAGAEELCLAYANTYKLPVVIAHTMNLGGERQHPEKFIPSTIRKVHLGEKVIIHSDKDKITPGSRFYIHCRNAASAIEMLLEKGEPRDKYNIVGEREVTNLELAQMIADCVGKPLNYEMTDFHSQRPGHDLRYGLDGAKMRAMGWSNPKRIEEWLPKVVEWSLRSENKRWLGL